jgi:hypothetical protein
MFAVVLTVATIAGCSHDQQTTGNFDSEALNTMVQTESQFGDIALGSDLWEVVVCQIPSDTTDLLFAPVQERLNLSSGDIVAKLVPVIDYFSRWSHGRYQDRKSVV